MGSFMFYIGKQPIPVGLVNQGQHQTWLKSFTWLKHPNRLAKNSGYIEIMDNHLNIFLHKNKNTKTKRNKPEHPSLTDNKKNNA